MTTVAAVRLALPAEVVFSAVTSWLSIPHCDRCRAPGPFEVTWHPVSQQFGLRNACLVHLQDAVDRALDDSRDGDRVCVEHVTDKFAPAA